MHSIYDKLAAYASSKAYAHKPCLIDQKKTYTYEDASERIRAFAASLQNRAYPAGSPVLIRCTQDSTFILAVLAVQLAGYISVPLEKTAAMNRIRDILEDTGARIYIGPSDPELPDAEFIDIQELDRIPPAPGHAFAPINPDDTAEILFSTGTTGKPKGIVLTHGNNIANAENVIHGVSMKPENRELIPMPLSHSHGLRRVYANLCNGSTAVIINGVTLLKPMFEMMEKHQVTSLDMAPSILSMVLKLSKDKLGEYADQIDYIQLGSAPLVEEDKNRLMELLPRTRLYNFYGSTESGCSCILDFQHDQGRPNCIGRPTVHSSFRFVDENRNEISATPERPGLIATSGPMNMKGYLNAPELTASVTGEGYLYTKDLGYQDEEGYIYCLGRQDDIINSGGIKISPDEIESEARKYPAVKDCACVPVPDKMQGQAPKLYISLAVSRERYDSGDFRKFLKQNLDGNKVPKKIGIIDTIPRTSNGKIQRKKLILMHQKG